jgi:hypothetical protein
MVHRTSRRAVGSTTNAMLTWSWRDQLRFLRAVGDTHQVGRSGTSERHPGNGDDYLAALREALPPCGLAGNHDHFIHIGHAVNSHRMDAPNDGKSTGNRLDRRQTQDGAFRPLPRGAGV